MKTLVTGALGFIGLNLCHYLKNGPFLLIDKNNNDDLLSDATIQKIREFKPDNIVHLAAISSLPECESDPQKAYENNVIATLRLLNVCREFPINRFVFASTGAVYEGSPHKICCEGDEVLPDLIYAQTKLAAERLCYSYNDNYGLPCTILRFFNIYGPFQNKVRTSPPLTAYILNELLNNRIPKFFSDGYQNRDYVYVRDVLQAINIAIYNPKAIGRIFNVCSGKCYSVRDIFKIMSNLLNKTNVEPVYQPEHGFWNKYEELSNKNYNLSPNRIREEVVKTSRGNNQKIKQELGWEPVYDMESGLKEMINEETKGRNSNNQEYAGIC
jgi:UDP-glucose 4-epimerase